MAGPPGVGGAPGGAAGADQPVPGAGGGPATGGPAGPAGRSDRGSGRRRGRRAGHVRVTGWHLPGRGCSWRIGRCRRHGWSCCGDRRRDAAPAGTTSRPMLPPAPGLATTCSTGAPSDPGIVGQRCAATGRAWSRIDDEALRRTASPTSHVRHHRHPAHRPQHDPDAATGCAVHPATCCTPSWPWSCSSSPW